MLRYGVTLRDKQGEALQQRRGDVTFAEVQKLIAGGAPILICWGDPRWVMNTGSWWQEHHRQVHTKDHPAIGWPDHEEYGAEVWFSSAGRVIVFDVAC